MERETNPDLDVTNRVARPPNTAPVSTIEAEAEAAAEAAIQEELARKKLMARNHMMGSLPSLASTIEEEAAVEQRMSTKIYRKLREFSLDTTGHGLPRIVEAEHLYMKLIWLACYLVSIGLCVFMVYRSLEQFFSWGVSSQIVVVSMPKIVFPVISICNVNPIVTPAGNSYLRDYYNREFGLNLTSYPDFYRAMKNGQLKDQTDWVLYQTYMAGFNETLKKSFGFNSSTMFANCRFANQPCDPTTFEWFYHSKYGNCFRFNSGVNSKNQSMDLMSIKVQGTGFYIEIFGGLPDTFYDYFYETPNRGLVVLVENQANFPLLGKNGVSVNLASYTKMVITHSSYKKSPAPYSDCPDLKTLNTSLANELHLLNFTYSRTNCMILCEQKQYVDRLGCYDVRFPRIFNARPCSTAAEFGQIKNLTLNLTECVTQCPYECDTEEYGLSISYTDFPSWDYYYQQVHSRADFYQRLFNRNLSEITYDMYSSSVASLFLYYDDLVDTEITESPSLTPVSLISNIGGILGLFIGVSILSFVEFIELGITFIIIAVQEYKLKKREELEMKRNQTANGVKATPPV